MDLNSLKAVYIHLLRDMHSAETQLLRALPKMAKAVNSPELKKGFLQHAEQTREHVARIEKICTELGVRPGGKKCEGMAGLITEAEDALKEKGDPASKDAAIIVDAQKIEHYEIAGYGSAVTFAKTLGFVQQARQLEKTLNEEYLTDEKLDKVAMRNVNRCALEEGKGSDKKTSGSRKPASAKSKAGSGTSKGRSAKSSGTSAKSAGASRATSAKTGSAKAASKQTSAKSGSVIKAAAGKKSAAKSKSAKPAAKSSASGTSRSRSKSTKTASKGKNSSSTESSGAVTTNHDKIRRWVEERGGHPACVKGTGNGGDTGLLRIDYPGFSGEDTLQEIQWDEFFEKFDKEKLAFLHQDETADGKQSRFSKLISRKKGK